MRVDRVDGNVERLGDLGPREVCREKSQHPQLAWAELSRLRDALPVSGGRRCALYQVNDIGEQTAVRRLVPWEDSEELGSVVHREREDQSIWFSGSQGGLGCGSGGVPIAQSEVREASEHMSFDECVRREADRRHEVQNVSEESQRRGGVSFGETYCCPPEVNGVYPLVFGGEPVERGTRIVWHPETSLCSREPFGDHPSENVHTGKKRLRLHRCG